MFSPSQSNVTLHVQQIPRCALLTAVLDMLTGGIVVIDVDRSVLFANARARRVAPIDESPPFRLADPRADEELGAALAATKAALRCGTACDGPAEFRLVKLPNLQAGCLLVLAASAAGKAEPSR